jgi:hypothetical protein
VTVLAEGADAEADGICVDWNSVELHKGTDLVIAPMADTEMAKMFGIPVDDRDKEKEKEMDEAVADDGKSHIYEDVDGALMDAAAYDVDDAHDDDLVTVYDKENTVIAVGKLFPNMGEFRMCFKTYAVKKEFEAKTMWTDRKKFYARCRGYDGAPSLASGTFLLDANLIEVPSGLIKSHLNVLALLVHREYQQ